MTAKDFDPISGLWRISRDDNVARSPAAGTCASQAPLVTALLPARGPVAPRVPSWVPGGPPTPLPARTLTAIIQKYGPEPTSGIRSFAIMNTRLYDQSAQAAATSIRLSSLA